MRTFNYPDGRKMNSKPKVAKVDHRKSEYKSEEQKVRESYLKANMGMNFEKDVTRSCDFYREKGLADIYKRPTPIKVVKMSKERPGMIQEAYFEEKSTTDYVGIYKGKYIDFECKETIHDYIPYHMIREQQYRHLDSIIQKGGIGFFLVSFKAVQEVYLIPAKIILDAEKETYHRGFRRSFFSENGILVERSYLPPYKLLEAIDKAFFTE